MNKNISTTTGAGILIVVFLLVLVGLAVAKQCMDSRGSERWAHGSKKEGREHNRNYAKNGDREQKQDPTQAPMQTPAQTAMQTQKQTMAGYKNVRVSNGEIAFTFDIPEKWLTETRHAGEKQLTIDEMRDFLATNYDGDIKNNPSLTSDYADLPWSELQKMSDAQIKEAYMRAEYPLASVASSSHIWYTDTSWNQVDFAVLYDQSLSAYSEKMESIWKQCQQDSKSIYNDIAIIAKCDIAKPVSYTHLTLPTTSRV